MIVFDQLVKYAVRYGMNAGDSIALLEKRVSYNVYPEQRRCVQHVGAAVDSADSRPAGGHSSRARTALYEAEGMEPADARVGSIHMRRRAGQSHRQE